MQEGIKRLAAELNDVNPSLTILEARSWVELLWEDFESTRAKAGREYEGVEVTQKIVRHWIQQYGDRLDDFMTRYPKYQEMIYGENNTKH
ncbi:YfhJ family protein [Gracilibacillus caseinilyticus]|uniref:YfhJ family protein n=1 Tax=Gracilibacillus caseinilyticus TaxID=2932256 RepID=A0ABY4EY97_9BACI|nr:YfhJ family protein [Gracilibacillus caseinilyticus]UOQ48827.1 YfhJ family protein [Gracilibacillus caseinilyticus]